MPVWKSQGVGCQSPLPMSESDWIGKEFESVDERLDSFLQILDDDPDHTTRSLLNFLDYYYKNKPNLSVIQLKRIFNGTATSNGILHLLKGCHREVSLNKQKGIVKFFCRLMDNSKNHQID